MLAKSTGGPTGIETAAASSSDDRRYERDPNRATGSPLIRRIARVPVDRVSVGDESARAVSALVRAPGHVADPPVVVRSRFESLGVSRRYVFGVEGGIVARHITGSSGNIERGSRRFGGP